MPTAIVVYITAIYTVVCCSYDIVLPDPDEMVVYCKPTQLQKDIYRAVLEHEDLEFVLKMQDPCPCASGNKRGHCCYKVTLDVSVHCTQVHRYTVLMDTLPRMGSVMLSIQLACARLAVQSPKI